MPGFASSVSVSWSLSPKSVLPRAGPRAGRIRRALPPERGAKRDGPVAGILRETAGCLTIVRGVETSPRPIGQIAAGAIGGDRARARSISPPGYLPLLKESRIMRRLPIGVMLLSTAG